MFFRFVVGYLLTQSTASLQIITRGKFVHPAQSKLAKPEVYGLYSTPLGWTPIVIWTVVRPSVTARAPRARHTARPTAQRGRRGRPPKGPVLAAGPRSGAGRPPAEDSLATCLDNDCLQQLTFRGKESL